MPPRYLASVTCPACGTQFQTPVEQILDVRVDPGAKNRVLSGSANVAVCPACGTGGALGIPFIYHDPDQEIALLYLPVEAGPTEVQRQKAAGRLARQLMDSMPAEERKGYLLQPETFINLETLIKRVLEIEGITEDDLAHSQAQRAFVGELLDASREAWPEMVEAQAELVDEELFAFLEYMLQLSTATDNQPPEVEDMEALHEYLVEETEIGQRLAQRSQVVRGFAEDPSRASLLDALVAAPDAETIDVLVRSGVSLLDYGFFQMLVKRIDEADSAEDKAKLQQLRRRILELRDELTAEGEAEIRERAVLLTRLLTTEDPQRMAASHLSQLDELFFAVLGTQLAEAQQQGDQGAVEDLERVSEAVSEVIAEAMPPEIALARQLMATPEEHLDREIRANRELVTPRFVAFLEVIEQSLQEQGQEEALEHLGRVRAKVRSYVPEGERAPGITATSAEAQKSDDSEERTPSGLIIAKR